MMVKKMGRMLRMVCLLRIGMRMMMMMSILLRLLRLLLLLLLLRIGSAVELLVLRSLHLLSSSRSGISFF